MSVIDDKEMKEAIVETLVENYNYTLIEAAEFTAEYGSYIVDLMWDEFSNTINNIAVYKEQTIKEEQWKK